MFKRMEISELHLKVEFTFRGVFINREGTTSTLKSIAALYKTSVF